MLNRASYHSSKLGTAFAVLLVIGCVVAAGCGGARQVVPMPPGTSTSEMRPDAFCTMPHDSVFVADPGSSPYYNAMLAFDVGTLSGTQNLTPFMFIKGTSTQLSQDYGVVVDDDYNEYVSNANTNAITVYNWYDTGNIAPLGVISGGNTKLNGPLGLALDYGLSVEALYALNAGNHSITVYGEGHYGNVTPSRVISGSNTQLGDGAGIAVDQSGGTYNGYVYVTNKSSGKVLMFTPTANGNVTPFKVLSGSATDLTNPQGVAVDGSGNVYVTNINGAYNNAVLVYAPAPGGNQAPTRKIHGTSTNLNSPFGVTVWNYPNELFVSNAGANSITAYHATDNGNVAPFGTIAGSNTNLQAPAQIQFYHVCHMLDRPTSALP